MPRIFYTERDIQDLAKRGVKQIEVDDNVSITDVAREKMEALGIKAKTVSSGPAAPAPTGAPTLQSSTPSAPLSDMERQQVMEKVRNGVIARLGPGVDVTLVDTIVRRVVSQL